MEQKQQHLINNHIKSNHILLINEDGSKVGEFSFKDAISKAYEQDLDLMQVGEANGTAICKILKYDSWLYHEKKKREKQEFKNRSQDIKIIQLRPVTGDHDFMLKMKKVSEFLDDNHKVKIVIKFKNFRETTMRSVNDEIVNKILASVQEHGEIDGKVGFGQRDITLFIKPAKKHQATNKVKPN